MVLPGPRQRRVEFFGTRDPHRDALALLAPRRLDHHVAHLGQEVVVTGVEGGQPAARHHHPRLADDSPGEALVVAAAHDLRRGVLGERFSGDDAAPTVGQAHLAGLGIEDLNPYPAAQRLIGDGPGVRVEVVHRLRQRGEQRFVDRVLPSYRQHRHPPEAEFVVERDGRGVVVRDRQIHVGATLVPEMYCQGAS